MTVLWVCQACLEIQRMRRCSTLKATTPPDTASEYVTADAGRIKLHMEDRQEAKRQTQPIVEFVDSLLCVTRFNTRFRDDLPVAGPPKASQGLAKFGLLPATSLAGSRPFQNFHSLAEALPQPALHCEKEMQQAFFRYFLRTFAAPRASSKVDDGRPACEVVIMRKDQLVGVLGRLIGL